jgi:hypothetical protein
MYHSTSQANHRTLLCAPVYSIYAPHTVYLLHSLYCICIIALAIGGLELNQNIPEHRGRSAFGSY